MHIQSKAISINGSGITIPMGDVNMSYYLGGTHTMTGSIDIVASGTPATNTLIVFYFSAVISSYSESTNFIRFFNTAVIPLELITAGKCKIVCLYANSLWRVFFFPSWENNNIVTSDHIATDAITTTKILDDAVTNDKIADNAVRTIHILDSNVTLAKIEDIANNTFLGNDSGASNEPEALTLTAARTLLGQSITLTGDVTASPTAETAATGNTSLSTTIASGAVTTSKLSSGANTNFLVWDASFETGYQGTVTISFPFNCTIQSIKGCVRRAIAATDSGTIVLRNHGGAAMTGGSLTCAASDPIGTTYSSTVTANNTLTAGQNIQIGTVKTTAGGVVTLSITYLRT